MGNLEPKLEKNILGYTQDEMASAKTTSGYLLTLGLIIFVAQILIGSTGDWGELLGTLLVGIVLIQFIAWFTRKIVGLFNISPNRFDWFSRTFLIVSILALIPPLLSM